jgi:hypothetical protein
LIAPALDSLSLRHAKLSSSFHRDVAAGLFPQDWAGEIETLGEFGEALVAQ